MNHPTRYCFAIDLKNNANRIAEYDEYHKNVWREIIEHHRGSGITSMDIYRAGNRLFMIMEVAENFSFEGKAMRDNNSEKIREWEKLMSRLQQPLPFAKPGEKWVLMNKVFSLT